MKKNKIEEIDKKIEESLLELKKRLEKFGYNIRINKNNKELKEPVISYIG